MTDTTCACCTRPTADGWVCVSCTAKTAAHLRAIIELAPAGRLVAAGLVRRGNGGGGSNKPGSRSPGDDGAMDTMDAVTNSLTTIAREIADTRGLQTPRDGHALADPLTVVCSWLLGQMEWLRHASDDQEGPYAVAVFDEIGESARRIRRLVDGPAAQKYLGPCGAPAQVETTTLGELAEGRRTYVDGQRCDGDVRARDGAQFGRCRTCGAEWSTAERKAWLDAEVRASSFRASEIEEAYGISADLLRVWAHRGLVQVHDRDFLGRARYMLGEVLDVAAGQAAKRAEAQAKRARRAAEVGA